MTDTASMRSIGPGLGGPRRDAFRAAGRHSARVRLLRRVIVAVAALGAAGFVAYVVVGPFRTAIPSVSVDSVGLQGTKVTMDNPRLSGVRSDGRPYALNARSAVQDARTPNKLELHDIDAHITMGDKSVVHVVSTLGNYDSSAESMLFDNDVHITSDNGLDARMLTAFVDFKAGFVNTDQPVTVIMSTGTVASDTMHMDDNFKAVHFEGHVHSTMLPAGAAADTAKSLKGSGP